MDARGPPTTIGWAPPDEIDEEMDAKEEAAQLEAWERTYEDER